MQSNQILVRKIKAIKRVILEEELSTVTPIKTVKPSGLNTATGLVKFSPTWNSTPSWVGLASHTGTWTLDPWLDMIPDSKQTQILRLFIKTIYLVSGGVLHFILFTAPIVLLFTLSTLFAEPRVGDAQAGRMEEEARSSMNCRYAYSPLDGTAAVAADIT